MGRLQKKKTAVKKKGSADVADSLQAKLQTVDQRPALSEDGSGEARKRPVVYKRPVKTTKGPGGRLKSKYLDKAVQFLREVKVELKKVTWPTRKQTIGSTIVVIILVMIISLFLGVVDIGLSGLLRTVMQ